MTGTTATGRQLRYGGGPLVASALATGSAAVALAALGQPAWCECAGASPVSVDIWSMHNSQHALDPYSFTHLLHGIVFFAALAPLLRGPRARWRLTAAVALEAAWEVLENTPIVIERYRTATASLDYHGDTVINSLFDILSCAAGFLVAASVPAWASAVLFVATEIALLLWIRDSLVLNALMLAFPLEAVRRWQLGG